MLHLSPTISPQDLRTVPKVDILVLFSPLPPEVKPFTPFLKIWKSCRTLFKNLTPSNSLLPILLWRDMNNNLSLMIFISKLTFMKLLKNSSLFWLTTRELIFCQKLYKDTAHTTRSWLRKKLSPLSLLNHSTPTKKNKLRKLSRNPIPESTFPLNSKLILPLWVAFKCILVTNSWIAPLLPELIRSSLSSKSFLFEREYMLSWQFEKKYEGIRNIYIPRCYIGNFMIALVFPWSIHFDLIFWVYVPVMKEYPLLINII